MATKLKVFFPSNTIKHDLFSDQRESEKVKFSWYKNDVDTTLKQRRTRLIKNFMFFWNNCWNKVILIHWTKRAHKIPFLNGRCIIVVFSSRLNPTLFQRWIMVVFRWWRKSNQNRPKSDVGMTSCAYWEQSTRTAIPNNKRNSTITTGTATPKSYSK